MFTRANVGEWTRAVIPSPRATPLTNWVLPAPRSPDRPITSPLSAARPKVSPSRSVSAGLCEMNVAMRCQRPYSLLVADSDRIAGSNLPDAAQPHVGKLWLPGVEQRNGVTAGN